MIRRGRRWVVSDRGTAVLLALLAVAAVVAIAINPADVPINLPFLPLLLAVLLLSNRTLPWYALFMMVVITAATLLQDGYTRRTLVAIPVMYLLTLAVYVVSRKSARRLAVGRIRGESMLVDLRDRILAQGEIPPLPATWLVDSALMSAGGGSFAGDFVVATTRHQVRGDRLELAVVDVSGKGEAAGTRALQLSGAMGGLLGALPPQDFLSSTNEYLLQRVWEEGFATAIHLSLDLSTGDFELRAAGHPPAAQRLAGSGRWEILHTEGPVLGVLDDVRYVAVAGHLGPGDTLLLYTDGMVEQPRRDIELGIDAMLGEAESLLRTSWDGLAERLVRAVGSPDDDRALLLVHRRP